MLPPELITLLLLATTTIALPQNEPLANVTVSTTDPIGDTTVNPSISIPPPSDPTGDPGNELQEPPPWIDFCEIESCTPVNLIPELPTATGWEDDNNNIQQPTLVGPPTQSNRVVVTTRPTIIGITTNTQPRETGRSSKNDPITRPGGGGPNANGDNINPAPTGQDALLENIVSGLGDAPGRVQAQSAQAPVTPAPGASAPQLTATVGGVITAGEVPLTLTPGLSTTIGVEADATFIGITTNVAGQTVITISSSGTAVTATVTDAPLTVTLPKTGFEASITNAARPGQWSSSAAGTAASTSSRGVAMGQLGLRSWWTGAVMGVLGAVVAM